MIPDMSYDIRTIDELVEALGGPGELAASLGLTSSAVCNWSIRGFISPCWHVRLLYELRRIGKRADPELFEATEEQFAALFPDTHGGEKPVRKRGNAQSVAA